MKLSEFCEKTGATPRQVRYWSYSMPLCKNELTPYDRNRDYDEKVVPQVRAVAMISDKFGGHFSIDTLVKIFFEYPYGELDFGDGVKVTWRVDA